MNTVVKAPAKSISLTGKNAIFNLPLLIYSIYIQNPKKIFNQARVHVVGRKVKLQVTSTARVQYPVAGTLHPASTRTLLPRVQLPLVEILCRDVHANIYKGGLPYSLMTYNLSK